MLVLGRKPGECVRVGTKVRITVVRIENNAVRIGIEAPDEVPIRREEIAFEVPEMSVAKAVER